MTFDRFDGKPWKEGSTDAFYANAADTEFCFFNLLETPGGFEFELHHTGKRTIPQRMERGDKHRGTYRVPGNVETTGKMLQLITEEASKAEDPVPVIQRLLRNCRWQPGKDKGFG